MKKLFGLLMIAGMMSFVACGPSAEEEAAKQARLDSLLKDSLMKDSIAKAEIEQARLDSIAKAQADSVAQTDSTAAEAKKSK